MEQPYRTPFDKGTNPKLNKVHIGRTGTLNLCFTLTGRSHPPTRDILLGGSLSAESGNNLTAVGALHETNPPNTVPSRGSEISVGTRSNPAISATQPHLPLYCIRTPFVDAPRNLSWPPRASRAPTPACASKGETCRACTLRWARLRQTAPGSQTRNRSLPSLVATVVAAVCKQVTRSGARVAGMGG